MKFIFCWSIVLVCLVACSKEQVVSTTLETAVASPKSSPFTDADVVYHYKGVAYPLTYEEGSTEDFVEDEYYLAVKEWLEGANLTPFLFSAHPENHLYYFDSEFEGYDYYEKNVNALLGRRFKNALRIEELREQLIAEYGAPLDYRNPALYAAAHAGIESIYDELEILSPFPNDIATYIGIPEGSLSQSNGRNRAVFTVYEHDNQGGYSLDIERGVNTLIWTYGAYNCFTMAAHPDLGTELRPDNHTWSDCISSRCLEFPDGADGMVTGYYNDRNYPKIGCRYLIHLIDRTRGDVFATCFNFRNQPFGGTLCGHMNDQMTSIRIKAAWQGCTVDYSNV